VRPELRDLVGKSLGESLAELVRSGMTKEAARLFLEGARKNGKFDLGPTGLVRLPATEKTRPD
jgi:hypothetical protein